MMESRDIEYLEAMGIDVWQPRTRAPGAAEVADEPLLALAEGAADILCIVESPHQAQLELATGIGRAMRVAPVWAWPVDDAEAGQEVRTLREAIGEQLLTRVLVFGDALATRVLGARIPAVISAARIHVVPGLKDIASDQQAKRTLWKLMLDHGIAAPRKPSGDS